MALAGSTPVSAGAVEVTVTVDPPIAAYTPLVSTSWNTTMFVVSTSDTAFSIGFGTPAPAAGGTLYWQINAGPNPPTPEGQLSTLGAYLDDLRRLLRDPIDQYFPVTDKIAYINRGMQRRDIDTGANRQLITFPLVIGQDTYSFTDTGQGQVFDVIGINLIFVAQRIVLRRMSYTELNVRYRQWTPYQGVVEAWTRYGPNQIIFGPAPSIAYTTEWDCSVYAVPLVNLTDVDPLPYPYTSPVPYYAAYWAKMNERQYDEADGFRQMYADQLQMAVNARIATVPSMYPNGITVLR